MMGLSNLRQQRRCRQSKMCQKNRQQQQRCWKMKQKRQSTRVNVSDGGGGGVFTSPGDWRRQQRRWQRNIDPRTQQRQWRRWRRTRNTQRVRGIEDNRGGDEGSETKKEAAALRWRAWGICDNGGGVGRGRWAQGLDDNNRGIIRGSRRDDAPKWTSPMAEAPVCLRA